MSVPIVSGHCTVGQAKEGWLDLNESAAQTYKYCTILPTLSIPGAQLFPSKPLMFPVTLIHTSLRRRLCFQKSQRGHYISPVTTHREDEGE